MGMTGRENVLKKAEYLKETKRLYKEAILKRGGILQQPQVLKTYGEGIKSIDMSSYGNVVCSLDDQRLWRHDWGEWEPNLVHTIESIDVSVWPNKNLGDTKSMFKYFSSLKVIDFTGFNADACYSMALMFYGCVSLESVNITSLNTTKCYNFTYMFYDCKSLKQIKLPVFTFTRNDIEMQYMFYGCSKLQSIDISNWDTSKIKDMYMIFYKCYSLANIIWPNNWVYKARDLDLKDCPLTEACIKDLVNKLGMTSTISTIRVNSNVLSYLNAADIAYAKNRGFEITDN